MNNNKLGSVTKGSGVFSHKVLL